MNESKNDTLRGGNDKLRVGVSGCLLGQQVRWDGGHKRDRFLTEALAPWFEWVDVCPEMGIGLGSPRETLRLSGNVENPRLIAGKSDADWTEPMREFARAKVDELAALDLCGFILKSDSPSCGMERVRVWSAKGMPRRDGVGLFARALLDRFPLLPIEEEGRLHDPGLRESFVDRVFALGRWRAFLREPATARRLIDFHRVHKYQLMAHSPSACTALGRVVATAGARPIGEVVEPYAGGLMAALATKATVKRHVNVLQHLAGYFKDRLDARGKQELVHAFEDYRRRLVPLSVPIALVRHHVRALDVEYLADQVYLAPSPKELALRNYT